MNECQEASCLSTQKYFKCLTTTFICKVPGLGHKVNATNLKVDFDFDHYLHSLRKSVLGFVTCLSAGTF